MGALASVACAADHQGGHTSGEAVRRFVVVPLLLGAALISSCANVVRGPLVSRTSHATRSTAIDVAFVGDSNVVRGTTETITALRGPDAKVSAASRHYLPAFFARAGMRLNPSFFAHEFSSPRFHPDAVVLNIGINDTLRPDLYVRYGKRIDKFMALFPPGVPVLFPTYPVAIEPPLRREGAAVVNRAWWAAVRRWPNLQILRWGAVADGHPEWIDVSNPDPEQHVHYTHAGYDALARFELAALNKLR
jgi:hypothetical protein